MDSLQKSEVTEGGEVTFGIVQDSLDEDGILGQSLGHQQDALLDAVAAQQRPAARPLMLCDGDKQGANVRTRQR